MKRTYKLCIAALIGIVVFATVFGQTYTKATPFNETVEGAGNYFILGTSYPTSIQIAGYDARADMIYLNFRLETTKSIGINETPTFYYFVEIFDNESRLLANLGSFSDLEEAPAYEAGNDFVSLEHINLQLSSPLTTSYRVVVTVESIAT
ncbi:hypothetical protein [Desulfuribacillus alkaliarsenatis]|uniref:Uncharacterized protein n=1 Tax=Desulfuribacillus alkaliarsenatis TaxID=766136 RepID=A0A1E5G2R8_9FIRM|nr:hypothetical protein [Desulfuribacillus alkaliarsenatis]OEF97367.1 hypothetical protein BHF68_03925 [Desulfuribacillus alkaliarsenatis]